MKALIAVDVQNDFCPGGALAVPEGDQIGEAVNRLAEDAPLVEPGGGEHPVEELRAAGVKVV